MLCGFSCRAAAVSWCYTGGIEGFRDVLISESCIAWKVSKLRRDGFLSFFTSHLTYWKLLDFLIFHDLYVGYLFCGWHADFLKVNRRPRSEHSIDGLQPLSLCSEKLRNGRVCFCCVSKRASTFESGADDEIYREPNAGSARNIRMKRNDCIHIKLREFF